MFIEKEKNKTYCRKIVLNESMLRGIIKNVLEEALGSFKSQENMAEYCVEKLFIMLKNNIFKTTFNYDSDNIKKITILYNPNESTIGKLVSYNHKDKSIKIEIGRNIIQNMSKDDIVYKIAHELMHGNIYLSPKKYETSLKMELDVPEYYGKLIKMLNTLNGDDIAYNFAYGLYSTFYQETQAIISQTSSEIRSIIRKYNLKNINREVFYDIVEQCKSYNTFKLNISDCCDTIDSLDDEQLKKYIIDPFSDFDIKIDKPFIRKMNKKIRKISNEAIRKCINNAMLVYYDLEKEERIK